jgi:hypothetical protein
MGISGMNTEEGRRLAAALEVTGGALAVQGHLIRGILSKWNGDQGQLTSFPSRSTWAQDQAKDVRRRLGLLEQDPEAVMMFAGLSGVLETWQKVENSDEYKQYQEIKRDITTPLKLLKVPTGIEASVRLYQRWAQGQNVAGARAVFELNKYFGVEADRLKLKRVDLLKELLKDQSIRNVYKEPWKWQQAVRPVAQRLRIPYADKLFTKAPGTGFLATRVLLPLNIVTGVKEMILPTHDGAQGWVDRGMGGIQAAGAVAVLGGASMATALGASAAVAAAVPVVGWAALGIAGAYFLGSWVADKWGDDIASEAKKAWQGTKNFVKKLKFW